MSEPQPPHHMEKPLVHESRGTTECYICGKRAISACYRCHKHICTEHTREHQLFYSEKLPTFCANCEKITDDMLSLE
jgi:hypothetical protein